MALSDKEMLRLGNLISTRKQTDFSTLSGNSNTGGSSVTDRLAEVGQGNADKISQAIKGEGQYQGQSPLTRGIAATATGFNTVPQAAVALAPEPIRKGVEVVGGAVGDAFKAFTDLIGSNPQLQKFTQDHPDATSKIIGTLQGASDLGAISGNILGAQGVANSLAKTTSLVGDTAKGVTEKIVTTAGDTIENFGSKITTPSVTNATRVSLNPKEALKSTGQDIVVTVGGKQKKLSELTPTENTKMQFSTEKSINKFTQEAEKFKNNRNPKNDPTEIVGNRVDAALNFADRKRQYVGKKMGEIEQKYAGDSLPIGEKTLNQFSETLKSIDNPKFGVDTADAPIVKKLVTDFDNLEKGGASIADRLDFVRSWDKYLNDAKDAFGNFKENATVNARIQGAVKTLKNETVDAIAAKDKVYKGLRTQYSTFKKLDDIGNSLLGKSGALGDRIKGGATVKRALKSNSDAGARQFLTQLKELTGYDAIKDGDLALTAMENVGDFQGLSLLEVLKSGKSGIVGSVLEKAQSMVVGDSAARVKNYIKKGVNPKAKTPQK